jgi:hypothetical protein
MDERFRGKVHWVALGVAAIVFLCVMLCALGVFSMLLIRSDAVYVQPSTGEEGAAPPASYGPFQAGHYAHWEPFGIIGAGLSLAFKLLLFGLLLLLFFGLFKRLLWGHRYWCPPYWSKPPKGQEGEGKPGSAWGPWTWHHHHHRPHWGPPPGWAPRSEPVGDESEPDSQESTYTGPQE